MSSNVEICNIALSRIGDTLITDLNENSKQARTCKLLYEPERDLLLHSHYWNFAMKRKSLAQLSEAPDFEYDYQYQLPTDYLRDRELYESTANYVIEGDRLLINEDVVYLKYIARITDPNKFNPAFLICLALKMGAELSIRLADSKTLKKLTLQEYLMQIREAYRLNAIEGNPPEDMDDTDWQSAGR